MARTVPKQDDQRGLIAYWVAQEVNKKKRWNQKAFCAEIKDTSTSSYKNTDRSLGWLVTIKENGYDISIFFCQDDNFNFQWRFFDNNIEQVAVEYEDPNCLAKVFKMIKAVSDQYDSLCNLISKSNDIIRNI